MKILFDIGHADNTGARGNKQEEHDLCTRVVQRLSTRRMQKGDDIRILDFPTMGNTEDLQATIRTAGAHRDASFGVSFHMDSGPATARGGHVCYLSTKGKQLAEAIAGPLCRAMPGRADKTVRRTDLAILNRTAQPWVLLELGFITSAGDILRLMDMPQTPEDELEPLLSALDQGLDSACALAACWT